MRYFLVIVSLTLFYSSCKNKTGFTITEKPFGQYEGKKVTEYSIRNPSGMEVGVINYGGTLTKILVPDRDGKYGDVITGFESLEGYLQKGNPYFGSLVGRYANRIANATFIQDSVTYALAPNNDGNSLHGGNKGFDKVFWDIEKMPGDSSLKLTYLSKDGEEGYPGNLNVTVIYTVYSGNALKIEYSATTDKATPVNLTSHGYFNLSAGRDSTILGHQLIIVSNSFTTVDDKLIPTGEIQKVDGTPFDFNKWKLIGSDIDKVSGGFDHNWILDKKVKTFDQAAALYDSVSGRRMDVWTTEPAIQFYSGNFLDGTLTLTKDGAKYIKYGALCLETQHYPDSPNQPKFPSTILRPGAAYQHTCVYEFSTQ